MATSQKTVSGRSERRAGGNLTNHERQPSLFDHEQISALTPEGQLRDRDTGCVRCNTTYLPVSLVAERFGASPATIWRWVQDEPMFPAPVKLSSGMSRWRLAELVDFQSLRAAVRVELEKCCAQ